MINFFKNFRFKYIFYGLHESIEFIFGFIFTFVFGYFQSIISYYLKIQINLRDSFITNAYESILDKLPQYGGLDTIRADLGVISFVFVYLTLDVVCILITSKSIFDICCFTKYENSESKGTQKLKMILYAFIKYFAISLWIFSWKVDSIFFVVYSMLFYLYFPISLITRIATKSKQSILFYFLNLKNI